MALPDKAQIAGIVAASLADIKPGTFVGVTAMRDRSDFKIGAKVFIVAVKQPDGTLLGHAWRVGRNGIMPPM